jgi:pilus assembly protein Flp/PilA
MIDQRFRRFLRDESGATAIEYGLIAGLIAVGIIGAMTAFGGGLTGMFEFLQEKAGGAMDDASGAGG